MRRFKGGVDDESRFIRMLVETGRLGSRHSLIPGPFPGGRREFTMHAERSGAGSLSQAIPPCLFRPLAGEEWGEAALSRRFCRNPPRPPVGEGWGED